MMRQFKQCSFVSSNAEIGANFSVGEFTVVDSNDSQPREKTKIGHDVQIGSHCIIESNVYIGNRVVVDHRCTIYSGAHIGDDVKVLYGAKIFGNATVGSECIVGSDIPERMVLHQRVTFLGQVAHSYRDATNDWVSTHEPSPTIGEGSIVGLNALIIGGIEVGKNCYVGAGETLRHSLPDDSVYLHGKVVPIIAFRGLIRTRWVESGSLP